VTAGWGEKIRSGEELQATLTNSAVLAQKTRVILVMGPNA